MTRVWWLGGFTAFAMVSVTALYLMAPFHRTTVVVFVLLAPLLAIFVVPRALKAALNNISRLSHSFAWWHWLILLSLLSGLVFRLREIQQINENPLDAAALFRLGVNGIVIFVLLTRAINSRRPWVRTLFRGLLGVLTLFALFSLISTLWSVRPLWTLYKSVEYLADIAIFGSIVAWMASPDRYESVLNWVWTLLGLMVVAAWIGAAIDPRDAFDYGETAVHRIPELTGVMPVLAANAIGQIAAILSIVTLSRLWLRPKNDLNRDWYKMVLFFSIVTLFVAQSRSAIAGFLVGLMLLLFLSRQVLWGVVLATGGAAVLIFAEMQKGLTEYLLRGQDVAAAEGLTGRVDWWTFAWEKFLHRPLTGWGGFAGGRFVVLASFGQGNIPDIHSSIVEALVDTGVFGLLLLLLALLGSGWYLLRGIRSGRLKRVEECLAIECLAVLGVLTVRCAMSSTLTSHPALPFLVVVGYAEIVRRQLKFAVP
jgi:O-antigen ligase